MPTIEIARCAGACYGVERALRMVEECIGSDSRVYTYGPLIHNPAVVAGFRLRGVNVAENIEDVPSPSTVVIRSHGVVPQIIEEARALGHDVVDATCPHVKKAHEAASRLAGEGYQVVVVGEPGHPEVEGILARAGSEAFVASSAEDIFEAPLAKKVGVVVQTTQTNELLTEVVCAALSRAREVKVFNTICAATSQRQQAARELAARCDTMVVVGGKNSGNTRRLYEVCLETCAKTYHVESPSELLPEWFAGCELIGITAGASTPASQIDGVASTLREMAP